MKVVIDTTVIVKATICSVTQFKERFMDDARE
jgi:predicted nucleic acid-binding protein